MKRSEIMRFHITHTTRYKFSSEVYLEPHYIRLQPRILQHIGLKSYNLGITPKPQGIREYIDAENNNIHFCWFEDTVDELIIEAKSIVETHTFNPFDFIIYPGTYLELPFEYENALKQALHACLLPEGLSAPLIRFGQENLNNVNGHVISFLSKLIVNIYHNFIKTRRHKGSPFAPSDTFDGKKGSCRDLTWMLINLLRYFGLASRFVSGYLYISESAKEPELHAWAEVFIPGAGWIGLDPSMGVFVNEYYIPLVASASYENAMPISGTIRGSVSSVLKTSLSIEKLI